MIESKGHSPTEKPPKKRATTVKHLPPRKPQGEARLLTDEELRETLGHRLDLMELKLQDEIRGMVGANDDIRLIEKRNSRRLDFLEKSLAAHGKRFVEIEKALGILTPTKGPVIPPAKAIPGPESEAAHD